MTDVYIKSDFLPKLLSKQKFYLSELKKNSRVISVKTVQTWINDLVKFIVEEIDENDNLNELTPIDSTEDNTSLLPNSQQILVNTQDITQETDENDDKSIENRVISLEKLVEKLILQNVNTKHVSSQTHVKKNNQKPIKSNNHRNNIHRNNSHRNDSHRYYDNQNDSHRKDSHKNCWNCGKVGHLSYQCHHRIRRSDNYIENQRYYRRPMIFDNTQHNSSHFLLNPLRYPGPPIPVYTQNIQTNPQQIPIQQQFPQQMPNNY